jgi:hypothetical protein
MRTTVFVNCAARLALALSLSACSSTAPDEPGSWGSDQVAITIKNGVTTLEILAGSCYGSYGELDQPILPGTFLVSGRYVQLTGVYPGKVVYPATYSGVRADNQMTITIAVPALQASFGPFLLTRRVDSGWEPCLYP